MIISGGVNIYPQEIENELIMHPKVEDVAVIGVPHPEFGEEVKAVVQPVAGVNADEALAEELIAYTRERLAAYKCPRSIDFESETPAAAHRQALQAPAQGSLLGPRRLEDRPGVGSERGRAQEAGEWRLSMDMFSPNSGG